MTLEIVLLWDTVQLKSFKVSGERIINIHVKDRPYKGSTVPLGKGDVNFDLIFELIKKYNYNGNLILQTARSKIMIIWEFY